MTTKRRGLGRGLEALLGENSDSVKKAHEQSEGKTESLLNIPVDKIQRGKYQPRIHFEPEALQALANSIRSQGVLQPIVVRPVGNGYELIAGERRWRAAQLAELQDIPAVVRENLPDEAVAAIALIENIQRENLNPLEEAKAFARLIEEFDMSHQQLADAVGRSRVAVTNILRLRDLQADVKQMLERRELDMGHARALLSLPAHRQIEIARRIVANGLTVRDAERLAKKALQDDESEQKPATRKNQDSDIKRLEQQLSDQLAASVSIQHAASGKGKLIIHYTSSDELEGILVRIK